MKMKLIFPPAWDIKSPYPSLPCLTGYLRAQGEDVVQVDLNLELFDHLLSKEYLSACLMEAKEKNFSEAQLKVCEYLRDNIDECKATLRSEKALAPEVYRSCMALVKNGIHIIDSLREDESLSMSGYSFRGYGRGSSEILRCVADIMSGKLRSRVKDILDPFVEEFVADSDVIGISVSSQGQLMAAFLIAAMCKALKPSVKIVMGGSLITRLSKTPDKLADMFSCIDYFSFFEGEYSLSRLMKYLRGEEEISRVPGLGYLSDGKVVVNPGESVSMDELPTPLYDEENLHRYFSPAPVLTLYTCRGCYWNKCAFCDHAAVYQDCFRTRSLELIIEDIETCVNKYGTKYIAFNDEAITAPMLKKLSREIIDRGIDIRWRNDARFSKALDEETFALAHKAGLRLVYFGLESYNERVLTLINKGIKREWVEPVLKAAKSAGTFNHVYIIKGFPTETEEEYAETVDFIEKNKDLIDYVCVSPFGCSRFSRVALHPEDYSVKLQNVDSDILSDNFSVTMEDNGEGYTFHDRFRSTKQIETSGKAFLDSYSNTAAVIFSDHLVRCSNRKSQGEETLCEFGTALYSADGKVHYASVVGKDRKVRLVKIPGALEPIYKIVSKHEFLADALSELSTNGYPEEFSRVMLEQLKALLR